MKKLLSLLLALSLLILSGCAYKPDPLLGTWYVQVDVQPQIHQRLTEEFPELAASIPQEPFPVTLEVTFLADGTYQAKVDETSVESPYEQYMAVLEDEIWKYLEDLYRQENPGGSVEGYLQSLGITREALFEEIIGTFFLQELLIELNVNHEGEYTQEDGKLYLSRLGKLEYYHKFEVKGKDSSQKLTLEPGSYQKQSQADYYDTVLPITFQRKKP